MLICHAHSIGLRARGILLPGVTGRVLASFERVCDLVTDGGAVVALVWDGIGDGPLNVVLHAKPGAALPAGARFGVSGGTLMAGCWRVELLSATPWDARPDWAWLRAQRQRMLVGSAVIQEALTAHERTVNAGRTPGILERADLPAALTGAVAQADREQDWPGVLAALTALCGLGPGLTPAGDDWLAGWLLASHCRSDAHVAPDATMGERRPTGFEALAGLLVSDRCRLKPRIQGRRAFFRADPHGSSDLEAAIAGMAAGRTTTLSRAFLVCAAAGEADAAWHNLLLALGGGDAPAISRAAQVILGHGATSGAAMLTGFLAGLEN